MNTPRLTSLVCLGLAASVLGGCSDSSSSGTALTPFRDSWEIEAEVPFEYLDADGVAQITTLDIGNSFPVGDNFMNRGDVIVQFEDTDTIKIEMRRFTMATNEDLAQADYDALQLWAYTGTVEPPSEKDDDEDCTSAWQNDCGILVYYEGQTQLQRSGADLRVTLPSAYRHSINIETADNDTDSDYHNRSNVCVENLNGTVDIDLGNAAAYVILDPNTTPMPRCPASDIMTCEGWPDGSGTEAWSSMCPCVAGIGEFGQVRVNSLDAASSDVTVDVPANLWVAANMSNDASGQDRSADCNASDPDGTCCANVEIPGYEVDPSIGDESSRNPWRNVGALNQPSDAAAQGAGFSISVTSKECSPVTRTASPDGFVGAGNGSMQDITERGNLRVCADCLRGQGCEALVTD